MSMHDGHNPMRDPPFVMDSLELKRRGPLHAGETAIVPANDECAALVRKSAVSGQLHQPDEAAPAIRIVCGIPQRR